ncbi:AAR2 family protein [Megaselia abdita]
MDERTAQQLFEEGAFALITDVPEGTEFGIDLSSYKTAENFRGVKMIPPGPHFLFTACQGIYGDSAPRVGYLHYFKSKEILLFSWNEEKEHLVKLNVSEEEIQRFRENIKDLDKFLAPYDYSEFSDWRSLTDTVSEDTVNKCNPECGMVQTSIELESCPDSERPRGKQVEKKLQNSNEEDLLPNLKPIQGTAPRFTEVPPKVPENCSSSEISKHSLDCEESVNFLMSSCLLIEEVQLSFALFLTGHSVESLAHWRHCLNRLSGSQNSIDKYQDFYLKYLEVLFYQLPLLPEELMAPNDMNTVYRDVRELLLNCFSGTLTIGAKKLMLGLEKTMNWRFDLDEDPDDLPVVVEI